MKNCLYILLVFVLKTSGTEAQTVNSTSQINNASTQKDTIQSFNHHFILKLNGKFGVVDENEKTVVPFVYEDIYFFDLNCFLVKQNDLWAISNYEHELLSAFEFIDVEKQNAINFKNFIYFINADTIANPPTSVYVRTIVYDPGSPYAEKNRTHAHNLIAKINSKILTKNCDKWTKQYILKKQDGFHIASFDSDDKKVQIDSMWWDNIYQLPGMSTIGVQRGKKFGYYTKEQKLKKYLKYDGIRFIAHCNHEWQRNRAFTNGARFYSTNAFTIIKNGKIYYRKESFIPWSNHDGRSRWIKLRPVKKYKLKK